jgi:hypothetical protein
VTDLVVFRNGTAVRPTRSRQTIEAARAIDGARTFEQAILLLEQAVRDGDLGLAHDFAPMAEYARRFVNTTAAHVSRGDDLGARAVMAIASLYIGAPTGGKPGRRRLPHPSASERDTVLKTYARWLALVAAAWEADDFLELIAKESPNVIPYRKQILRGRWRPRARPGDLAAHLTAWQLGVSLRRVRAARQRPAEMRSA